eukprot:3388297-Pyramimonas_sp.AAC.1
MAPHASTATCWDASPMHLAPQARKLHPRSPALAHRQSNNGDNPVCPTPAVENCTAHASLRPFETLPAPNDYCSTSPLTMSLLSSAKN